MTPPQMNRSAGLPLGFDPIDLACPLDVDACLQATPPEVTTKGMYFEPLWRPGPRPQLARDRYVAFLDYPLREWMQIAVACASTNHANQTLRRGLFLLGALAYPTLRESLLGKVLFQAAGRSVIGILKLATRAYEASLSKGSAQLIEHDESSARVGLYDLYAFCDCYHVGVIRGVVVACGKNVRSLGFNPRGKTSGEVFVTW